MYYFCHRSAHKSVSSARSIVVVIFVRVNHLLNHGCIMIVIFFLLVFTGCLPGFISEMTLYIDFGIHTHSATGRTPYRTHCKRTESNRRPPTRVYYQNPTPLTTATAVVLSVDKSTHLHIKKFVRRTSSSLSHFVLCRL